MRHILTIISMFFLSAKGFSQNGTVKGIAFDTSITRLGDTIQYNAVPLKRSRMEVLKTC